MRSTIAQRKRLQITHDYMLEESGTDDTDTDKEEK